MPDSDKRIGEIRTAVSRYYSIDETKLMTAIAAYANNKIGSSQLSDDVFSSLPKPLVPDLEQIEFNSVAQDPGIKSNLIERNLENALRYLQACSALRSEYSEIAKLYVDATLKSAEFSALDSIHQREIDSGLYELPLHESQDEEQGLTAAIANVQAQVATINSTSNLYFTGDSRTGYSHNSGQFVKLTTVGPPQANIDAAADINAKLADYQLDLSANSWQRDAYAAGATLNQLKSKLSTASRKTAYLENDVKYRIMRRTVSQQVAFAQMSENTRPRSSLNYRERLEAIRDLFNKTIVHLIARIIAIKTAAETLYAIDADFNSPSIGSILNYSAQWLMEMQDAVAAYRIGERTIVATISLDDVLKGDLSVITNEGGGTFGLTEAKTYGFPGLMRGIAFEYLSSKAGTTWPLSISLSPPSVATQDVAGHRAMLPTPKLFFGRVLPVNSGSDLRPQYVDQLWNGSPYDRWKLSIPKKDFETAELKDVFMYIWLGVP